MTKITYYWHIHHDTLCEGTTDIEERIAYIKNNKPSNEIPLRLKLMQKVKNPSKLPREWKEAFQKWEEAYQKWREADQKRRNAYQKWREADQKRRETAADHKFKLQIEALHKIEHPDCPWNGESIF